MLRPNKTVIFDNTSLYKFMTDETDMIKINEGTAETITFNELVYYLAMPDKNKIKSINGPVTGNAKKLLRDVLNKFNNDPKGQLKTAKEIINVLNSSNIIIEDLNDANIDDKIESIIDQSFPALPESKGILKPNTGVGLNLQPPGPALEQDGLPDPALEQDGLPDPALEQDGLPEPGADLGAPQALPEPIIEQTDLEDPEFKALFEKIEGIKNDLTEKDKLREVFQQYDISSNDMFDKLKKISNSDTAAVTNNQLGKDDKDTLEKAKIAYKDNPNNQTLSKEYKDLLNDATRTFTNINIKQITKDFNNEIFNSKQESIENYITEIIKKNNEIDDVLRKTDSPPNFSKLKPIAENIKIQINENEKVTKKINSINNIREELKGTIFAKSKDTMPSNDIITQNYYDRIVVYILLKETDLKYVQLPMTKKYESKYKDYDYTINNLIVNRIIDKPSIGNSSIGNLNTIKYNLYNQDDESITRKFFDIEYKIVGYKNIIDNYDKNVRAEYAQDKKIGTRNILCASIINYILNFLGPNYQNINNCFDFAGVEDAGDDKEWLKDYLLLGAMEIVFKKNPLPMNDRETSKEDAINSATAMAINEIAQPAAGNGPKSHFIETNPYASDNAEDRYKLNKIILNHSSSQSDTIKYLFVALNNYPTHVSSEFEKLKWPFNRLIPMIQEITAELKRAGRTTDGPENTPDGEEGLGKLITLPLQNKRVYKGGAKPVKKTFKKKSSKRKKTYKKLLNY